jgi:hypothetical protein
LRFSQSLPGQASPKGKIGIAAHTFRISAHTLPEISAHDGSEYPPARLRPGVLSSVPELVAAIDQYIAHHNIDPKPPIWTKSACDILLELIHA